ncbi:MAG: glycosyltransferase family 2 protein, partial [Planctomycetales bacterium]|nr:glycosyltransferase family 2 protein [Planctomycetales bacterium]
MLSLDPGRVADVDQILISVVIPVRNESQHIASTLQMLLNQDFDPGRYELLAVDGNSTDDTCALVRSLAAQHPQIRLLANPRQWSSAGRNVGVRAARGQIIVVIDGHCQIPTPQYFQHLAEAFADESIDVVGRPQPLTVEGASTLQKAIAAARASRIGHHPDSLIYSNQAQIAPAMSVGAAYRRRVFDKIGYFDEQFDACEDVDFNYRADQAGLRCLFDPKVAVHYFPRRTLHQLFHQLARYGRGRIRMLRKHPETFSWKSLAPAAVVGSFPCALALTCTVPYGWLLLLALTCGYALLVGLGSAFAAIASRQLALLPWLPLVFL